MVHTMESIDKFKLGRENLLTGVRSLDQKWVRNVPNEDFGVFSSRTWPILVSMTINFNWSFIFSGQVMITWHVTNPLECHNTSVTQLSWSTKMKRRWTVLKDKITVTGLLLVNLSRSDYFFHHIVLVLSHMESNQIPFFLVSSGTDQV